MAHLTVKYNRKEDSTRKLRKITHNYPTPSFSGQSKAKQTVMPKGPGSAGDQELTAKWPKSTQGQTLATRKRTSGGRRMGQQGGAH